MLEHLQWSSIRNLIKRSLMNVLVLRGGLKVRGVRFWLGLKVNNLNDTLETWTIINACFLLYGIYKDMQFQHSSTCNDVLKCGSKKVSIMSDVFWCLSRPIKVSAMASLLSSAAVAKRFSMLLFTLHALLITRVSTRSLSAQLSRAGVPQTAS